MSIAQEIEIVTIALTFTDGVYVLNSSDHRICSAVRTPEDTARRIRSAAATLHPKTVQLHWHDQAIIDPVMPYLVEIPSSERIGECLFYCSTTRRFFRPSAFRGIGPNAWAFCPFCDVNGNTGSFYNPDRPQPHIARITRKGTGR